jgi:hypothetical protein
MKNERRLLVMEKKYVFGIAAFAMVAILGVSLVSAMGLGNGFMGQTLSDEEKAEMQAQREAMKNAVESDDYAAWEGLMQERLAQMEDLISEETFTQMKERHAERSEFREAMQGAREAGDKEAMNEIREEFGMERGFGKGQAKGNRALAE